jgi:eukaryotic-like serine/threonine-protein kinase
MLESLGHYKILDRIGAGGIGEIYRARDTRLGRTVAIEVLSPDISRHAGRRERFLQDARASAVLSHPNIAALYEVGQEKDVTYLVCEFVPGEPLTTLVAGRSLNPRRAVDLAIQLADALADAHAEGIAHRNLKSSTITVTPKDKTKILDFGLAAWTRRPTPQAPSEDADYRADILALGAILFEMLTGKLPSGAGKPTSPSSMNSSVPRELDPIAVKALRKSPDESYESAATLAAELRSVAAILDVRSGLTEPPTLAPARRHRQSVAGWLIAALILAAVAVLVWLAARA